MRLNLVQITSIGLPPFCMLTSMTDHCYHYESQTVYEIIAKITLFLYHYLHNIKEICALECSSHSQNVLVTFHTSSKALVLHTFFQVL